MPITNGIEMVAIGGSAGSIPIVTGLLEALPVSFQYAIVIVLHRLRNVPSEMNRILAANRRDIVVREPDDKERIEPNRVYLAPQNYHLLIEDDGCFSLDYSELINYSRPSIDVTFESVADYYGSRAVAILLSGANADGAIGMEAIIAKGGYGIVQDPTTAEYPTMPLAAAQQNKQAIMLSPHHIASYCQRLTV